MTEDQNQTPADGGTTDNNEATTAVATNEGAEEGGEDASKQGQQPKTKILLDPRTGQPLRDQTPAAKDTGYLGNHTMQDKTEMLAPKDEPDEEDFKE